MITQYEFLACSSSRYSCPSISNCFFLAAKKLCGCCVGQNQALPRPSSPGGYQTRILLITPQLRENLFCPSYADLASHLQSIYTSKDVYATLPRKPPLGSIRLEELRQLADLCTNFQRPSQHTCGVWRYGCPGQPCAFY